VAAIFLSTEFYQNQLVSCDTFCVVSVSLTSSKLTTSVSSQVRIFRVQVCDGRRELLWNIAA